MADSLTARTNAGGISPEIWSLEIAKGLENFILPLEQICRVERAEIGDTVNIPVRTLPAASGLAEAETAAADTVTYSAVQPTVQDVVDRVKISRQLWNLASIDVQSDIIDGMTEKVGIHITTQVTNLFQSFATTTGTTGADVTMTTFMTAVGTMVAAGVPRNEMVAVLAPKAMGELLVSALGSAAHTVFGGEKLPVVGGVPVFEAPQIGNDGTDFYNFVGSKRRGAALAIWGNPWIDVQYAQDGSRGYIVEVGQHAKAIELIDLAGSWFKSQVA